MVVYSSEFQVFGEELPNLGARTQIEQACGGTIVGRYAGIETLPQSRTHLSDTPERHLVRIEGELDVATGNRRMGAHVGLHEFVKGTARLELLPQQPLEGLEQFSSAAPARNHAKGSESPGRKQRISGRQELLFKFKRDGEDAKIEYLASA